MRRDLDSEGERRRVGEVEVEGATSSTGLGQRRDHDTTDWIQKLTGHEHQNHHHQSLGHVVLRSSLPGHVLTTGRQCGSDVVLGLGPWLSLRTKSQSLVLALALSLESLLTSLQCG